MLTKLTIRNFKKFSDVEIELGNPVVFVGPNNSGKMTALQALALWDIGLKRWTEKRRGKAAPDKRPGVTINRRDLVAIPVPDASLLWRNLHTRDVRRVNDKVQTRNTRVDIIVEGVSQGTVWICGLEFDYANNESFYCRPLRRLDNGAMGRMPVPEEATRVQVAFLPPMSGLAEREFVKQPGEVSFLIGQGRTAEVLRNLCFGLSKDATAWAKVCDSIKGLFGVTLNTPKYVPERSEIEMTYQDRSGVSLDLSSTGRGLQQTLLLLAYLGANSHSLLLLDEPDAHLEILRQRQIYELLTETARAQDSQIIAASHSEVILNEAADRDVVVGFLGKPHRIDDRGRQLLKSLGEIGFDQYYQAEQQGWVLYLEGSTDLAILQAFAGTLSHPARAALERPFVHFVSNQPRKARDHFYGLREAKPDLVGFALFDRLDTPVRDREDLRERMWSRREIENYLCRRAVLLAWVDDLAKGQSERTEPLFVSQWATTMAECIAEIEHALATLGKGSPWSADIKATDDFLDPLFASFFAKIGLPNLMRKTNYHNLARFVSREQIAPEICDTLDSIVEVSRQAKPIRDMEDG